MNRADKARIIEGLKQKAGKASIAVVSDFKGIKVEELTPLRVQLRESGCDYQVVKNTLASLAVADGPHDILKDEFKENCAVAFGYDDPVAAAKVLVEFTKKNKKFAVKFGSLEGKYLDEAGIKALSELPSKEQLLGMTLGTMNAVPQNFVCLFANVIRGTLNALNAIKEQKEQA
ncbi:MAG TPA: 50S ribosomal protein L10 [Desulfomicrobiaceae bacterium]|nr:50S ribosomal protein L10 [Desulfomicrobiaceae bacterium]